MPWPLSKSSIASQRGAIRSIYVDDVLQDASGIQVAAGKKVKVVYNVPAGKKLQSIKFKNKSED